MKFTLITNTGRVYSFYIEEVAMTFQQAYGGTLIKIETEILQTVIREVNEQNI